MADPIQKVVDWAKANPKVAIPAAVIGGVGVLYLVSKSGGGIMPDGVSNNPPIGEQQADNGGTGSDSGLSSAVADLQNQLIQQQAEQAAQSEGFLGQLQALASSFQSALTGQQAQTQSALDSLASQTQAALDSVYNQQAAYGDNGLGQLLAQIPAFASQQQQYSSYDPFQFSPAALPTAIQQIVKTPVQNTRDYSRAINLRSTVLSLGKLSGYAQPLSTKPSAGIVQSFKNAVSQKLPVSINQFAAKNVVGFKSSTAKVGAPKSSFGLG